MRGGGGGEEIEVGVHHVFWWLQHSVGEGGDFDMKIPGYVCGYQESESVLILNNTLINVKHTHIERILHKCTLIF